VPLFDVRDVLDAHATCRWRTETIADMGISACPVPVHPFIRELIAPPGDAKQAET
jgi:hypothetical protein